MRDVKQLAAALSPILSRVNTRVHWVKKDGKLSHVKTPILPAKIERHLVNGTAIGAAPISPGQSVTLIALLDFDSHKGETPWERMQEVALTVVVEAERSGLKAIPFRSSGGAGIHLYFLWDAPQDAYSVRMALRGVLARCALASGVKGVADGEVEIFPKQDSVPDDGVGNMFILPLAGASVPLDSFELEDMPKDDAVDIEWAISRPVAPLVKPAQPIASTEGIAADLGRVKAALDAIPNSLDLELDYDAWRDIIFALHDATDGSTDGLALAHEFSSRSDKYDAAFLDERVWPYVRTERGGSKITAATLFHAAREAGWAEDVSDRFDVVVDKTGGAKVEAISPLERDLKTGKILLTVRNMQKALADTEMTQCHIGFDSFRAEMMRAPIDRPGEWAKFEDHDLLELRGALEDGGFRGEKGPVPKDLIRDTLDHAAQQHKFDSAAEWIGSLKWDGVPRVERFFEHCFSVADSAYTRAVSRYLWTALAGRALVPGIQADMVPVLVGAQGVGKSQGVAAIAPTQDTFTEIELSGKDDDTSRRLRGKLIAEIAELRGMGTRDAESIKAFITRTEESWIPKYKEFETTFKRRCIFIGTTNQDEIFSDQTGERRWLPLRVGEVDRVRIAAERDQLWAEARVLFEADGIAWRDAQTLAIDEHGKYRVTDGSWEEKISEWLDEYEMDAAEPRRASEFSVHQLLAGALELKSSQMDRKAEMRAAKALHALGFKKKQKRIGSARVWVWFVEPAS